MTSPSDDCRVIVEYYPYGRKKTIPPCMRNWKLYDDLSRLRLSRTR
jgi:hypothetical protein